MSIKLEAGQWYRVRGGSIVYCGNKSVKHKDAFLCECSSGPFVIRSNGMHYHGNSNWDVVEHLPDCTGFDWEPPKPIKPPSQWRLLTEGEVIESHDKWWSGSEWTEILSGRSSVGEKWSSRTHHLFIRKIEPKYMAFTWDQRDQIRDKWIKFFVDGKLKEMRISWFEEGDAGTHSINGYRAVWLFDNAKFLDGTPFGVRIDE